MKPEKKGSPSQTVKLGSEEIRSRARGNISKAAFTNGKAGPFSKEYLSGESIYDCLQVGELAHYLLVNKSKGVTIHPVDSGDSRSLNSDSGYRSVMAVTDCRILFALGGSEDTLVEINSEDVTGVSSQSDAWKKYITVTTESDQYEFPISIDESSNHEDAAKYIQNKLVPNRSPMDRSTGTSTSEPDRDDLIQEIHRLDESSSGDIGVSYVRKRSRYPVSAYLEEFGSWREVFRAAIQDESDEDAQDDGTVDSESKNNRVPSDQEERTQQKDEPTQEAVISEIERVSAQLGKRPTTSDFNTHSSLNTSDVYRRFESWGDALDAASLDTLSRQELLDEIHEMSEKLGFPPLSSHVDEQSHFSVYVYRQAFGSVDKAVEEAGLSVEGHVKDTLRRVVAERDDPKMADFEAASDYSAGMIYKFFDSWNDAVSAASPADDAKTVVQNELSERYELVRYLEKLCTAVRNVRQDQISEKSVNDPMEQWADKVAEFWKGASTQPEGYGSQHAERNPFSMEEYRDEFGDGEWVTEFNCVTARRPSPTREAIYKDLLDDTPSEIYLPVDEQTGESFPVIADTKQELSRAVGMLERLPAEPASADPNADAETEFEWEGENAPSATTSSESLQDVSGVTNKIEQSLRQSGFDTRSELKKASVDDLAEVDGVSKQVAMRIKLDVGG